MGDAPPPGYQGGSILEAPSTPVVMHKFHGGGKDTSSVSVGTDTRENVGIKGNYEPVLEEDHRSGEGEGEEEASKFSYTLERPATQEDLDPLTFREVRLSDILKDIAYTNICVLQLVQFDYVKEPYSVNGITVLPVKIPFTQDTLTTEVNDIMINECFLYGEGSTSDLQSLQKTPLQVLFYSDILKPVHKLSDLLKDLQSGSEESSSTTHAFTEPKTILLSNKLRVRWIPSDDSLKEAIMKHEFTDNERILFNNYLHFNKPFIVKYLQSDANKEDFYTFWKLYVNNDYANLQSLILKTDGIRVQDFLKKIHKMYVEYLKAKRSQYIGPESKRPYPQSFQEFLFEHPTAPRPPVTDVADELLTPVVAAEAPELPEAPEAAEAAEAAVAAEAAELPVASVVDEASEGSQTNSNSNTTNTSEESEECKTVDPIKVQGREIRKYIVALLKDPSKTPEQLIMSVIAYLDSKMSDTEVYLTKFSNTLTPIAVSNSRIITTPEKFIQDVTAAMRGCPGLNYTLKQLVSVNISKFSKSNKTKFINFFKKVTDETLHASLDKRIIGGSRRKTRRSTK